MGNWPSPLLRLKGFALKVLRIGPDDTWPLRQKLLRPGRPLDEVKFEGDDDEQTFHLGAFIDNKLVSVASFYYQKHLELEGDHHYRLRGMATHPDHQCKGLSRELLNVAFPIIKQNFCSLVWCNAREEAIGFYEKAGFSVKRGPFEIEGIGPHYLMYKSLDTPKY